MKIFIAGIGGVFMGGLAQLAKARGMQVRGCDAAVYPPMRDVLRARQIEFAEGYSPAHLGADPGMILIGNALSRGNPLVEHILANDLAFQSGAEWLRAQILTKRSVITVAGTHGKTTTASILAWLLEANGHSPGYLIGGAPGNFNSSARIGRGDYFVVEGDEYDTAFFDKRAKFVHYHPRIAVLNNLEFDHADIYDDINQIITQFHHLTRTVPGNGHIVVNADAPNLRRVLSLGCWSKLIRFSLADAQTTKAEWRARAVNDDCSSFDVLRDDKIAARVQWQCIGRHMMQNALGAIAAAEIAGVSAAEAAECLRDYVACARRMQLLFQSNSVCIYDDFAHHPTAISASIAAARARHPRSRIIALVELRSNTMKMGAHSASLANALALADCAMVCGAPSPRAFAESAREILQFAAPDEIIAALPAHRGDNDVIIAMSNGDFGGIAKRLAEIAAAPAVN